MGLPYWSGLWYYVHCSYPRPLQTTRLAEATRPQPLLIHEWIEEKELDLAKLSSLGFVHRSLIDIFLPILRLLSVFQD